MASLARFTAGTAGLVAWSFTEYAAHRWALHPTGDTVDVSHQHRLHHREPSATNRWARAAGMAAIGGVAIAASSILARFASGELAAAGAASWAAGYVVYDQYHWTLHHRAPRTAIGRTMRQRHFRHHFGAPQQNFGVTTTLWDSLFGSEAQLTPVRIPAKSVPPWLANSTDQRVRAMLVVDG